MANIQEVATRAGVSISTVSRVLNGTARVNADVAARVRSAMAELHYQPNSAARTLQSKRSRILGLLVTTIQQPFLARLIRGVEDVARQNGYSVLLCNSNEDPARERRNIELLCAERVAGTVVVTTSERPRDLHLFREHAIPVVGVEHRIADDDLDLVLLDHERGAREAVAHLLAGGYQRIGMITGSELSTASREYLEGYCRAYQEAGLAYDRRLVSYGDFKQEGGYRLTNELLDLEPVLDALFVGNNLMMLGCLDALYERQLRVPEDVALVGCDEVPWATLGATSLTTVVQPTYELGNTAAQRLCQRLQHPAAFTRQEIVLAPTLCIRDSSRARAVAAP